MSYPIFYPHCIGYDRWIASKINLDFADASTEKRGIHYPFDFTYV